MAVNIALYNYSIACKIFYYIDALQVKQVLIQSVPGQKFLRSRKLSSNLRIPLKVVSLLISFKSRIELRTKMLNDDDDDDDVNNDEEEPNPNRDRIKSHLNYSFLTKGLPNLNERSFRIIKGA